MFHKTKKLFQYFIRRVRGLIRYIYDYKLLLLSLLYILTSVIAINIPRNIFARNIMGQTLSLVISFLLLSLFTYSLRNIRSKRKVTMSPSVNSKIDVHNLCVTIVLVLTASLSFVKTVTSEERREEVANTIGRFTNVPVEFEGYIHEEVEEKQQHNYLTVVILQDILILDQTLPSDHGFLLIKVANFYEFKIGQVCTFDGVLVEPENFDTFDYKKYLNNKNIFLIMEDPLFSCFETSSRRGGNAFKNKLIDLKDNFTNEIDKKLHEPYSTLLLGMLFGKKRPLEKELQENIRVAGVSHIISASGYNITIVIIITDRLLIFLPKKIRTSLTILTIWAFALFAGFTSSITRACIMNSLFLLSLLLGRHNSKHIAIPFAAAIFLFFKPEIIYDIGFLMSLSATLGLNYILPVLKHLTSSKRKSYMENYILPTTSCTISTLPISIFTFKTFTIWSVVSNALILPVLKNSILIGLMAVSLSKIHPPLANFFYTVIILQFKYFELIVFKIANWGVGVWEITNPNGILITIFTSIIIILLTIYLYPVENEKYNYYLKDN